ncbi:MAG: alpha-1,2-fucosyltransferase [Bacteroidota bacterium]
MIIVKLQGGLGNQMFQYAAGKSLAVKHNVPLFLDHSYLERNNRSFNGFTARTYGLDIFNISGNRLSAQVIDQYFDSGSDSAVYAYTELPVSYDARFRTLKPAVHIRGNWQSPKYFKAVSDLLKNEFSFKESDLIEKNDLLVNQILNCNSVAIHVRRSDYITPPGISKIYHTCTVEYYQKAISAILDRFADIDFFVFSDDIKWAEGNLKTERASIHFIHRNLDADWLDMYLMSICKHNIIANSTFSWWAAWLNANVNKNIIAPSKWFEIVPPGFNINYLYPKEWVKI